MRTLVLTCTCAALLASGCATTHEPGVFGPFPNLIRAHAQDDSLGHATAAMADRADANHSDHAGASDPIVQAALTRELQIIRAKTAATQSAVAIGGLGMAGAGVAWLDRLGTENERARVPAYCLIAGGVLAAVVAVAP